MAIQNSIPADPRLGAALIGDADRVLRWARAWAAEFVEHARHARVDDAERTVHAFVSALGTLHETLLDATWHLGARQVRDELLEHRRIDPLLSYLWKAGQDAVLGRIVAWDKRANATEVVVVDRARAQTWMLGPSAAGDDGVVPGMVRHLAIPETQQRIFQSEAAALEETKRSDGIALAVRFAAAADLAAGRLTALDGPGMRAQGRWAATALPVHSQLPATAELLRFITTPRATQAMVHGAGVTRGRFKPSVHVTLWS